MEHREKVFLGRGGTGGYLTRAVHGQVEQRYLLTIQRQLVPFVCSSQSSTP